MNASSVPAALSLEREFVTKQEMKYRVMRVKKTLPGMLSGGKATALPPMYASKNSFNWTNKKSEKED